LSVLLRVFLRLVGAEVVASGVAFKPSGVSRRYDIEAGTGLVGGVRLSGFKHGKDAG